jgi:hypothetical protein
MFGWISRLVRRNKSAELMARNAAIASEAAGVPVYGQAMRLVAAELHRSRRYEHPLSVLVLSPDFRHSSNGKNRPAGHASSSLDSTYTAFFLLGSLVRDSLRESDIIAYAPEDQLYVAFLSESDHVAARHAARRFNEAFRECTSGRLRVGMAQFPADGFTIDDLVDHARKAWKERPLSDASGPPPAADGTHG